jgi:hypothetical protein
MVVTQSSPAHAKVALFRSLFRGREDVYPRRFESRKTGRSGYMPACAHEWVRGICEKPHVKCADCPHRHFLPMTDEVIRWQGNSVFLDEALTPWADQWKFLASVGKMGRAHVEEITQEAERRDRILGVRLPPQEDSDDQPWTAPPSRHHKDPPIVGPLPRTMEVVLRASHRRRVPSSVGAQLRAGGPPG